MLNKTKVLNIIKKKGTRQNFIVTSEKNKPIFKIKIGHSKKK